MFEQGAVRDRRDRGGGLTPSRRQMLFAGGAALGMAATRGLWGHMLEYPDSRRDADSFAKRISNIDDADLFAALDLSRAGLERVHAAAEQRDWRSAYVAWADYWPTAMSRGRFSGEVQYIGTREEAAEVARRDPDTAFRDAERVIQHNIKGWGEVSIQHGPVVDFNADYGKSGKYGFHYWNWAQPLIAAFLISRDQKFLDEFELLFNQWYEQREKVRGEWPGLDVIYYELGLGVRNRVFLEYYFLPQIKRSVQTHERMLKTLLGAARWLHDEESLGYRDGNWQVMGSYGLAHIGLMIPEFHESRAWVELGTQRMLEHVEKDFYPDGCHSERCPSSYMGIVYRDPRNLAKLLADDPTMAALSAKLRAPLERSLNFWLGILPPDGFVPGINDGSRSHMPAATLQDGFDLFGRRDLLFVKKSVLGAGVSTEAAEPRFTSIHFPISGFTAMRSDWTRDARYLLINHGPSGGGHSHHDSLSFELNAYGTAMAIDSGLCVTYDDPLYETWYRRSMAHNMITIDGDDLDRKAAEGEDVVWESNDRFDHFAATHHGYAASKGIALRRQIVYLKPDCFVIFDRIDASAAKQRHSVEWNAHLTVTHDHGPGLVVAPADDWKEHREKRIGNVNGIPGFKEFYGQVEWLKLGTHINAGDTLTTAVLLYPFAGKRPHVRIGRVGGSKVVVHAPGREDHLTFTPSSVELTTKVS